MARKSPFFCQTCGKWISSIDNKARHESTPYHQIRLRAYIQNSSSSEGTGTSTSTVPTVPIPNANPPLTAPGVPNNFTDQPQSTLTEPAKAYTYNVVPPSTSIAPATPNSFTDLSTVNETTLYQLGNDSHASNEAGLSTVASSHSEEGYTQSQPHLSDAGLYNVPIKLEEEELEEQRTEENNNANEELSSTTRNKQKLPEAPGRAMQDTFELFSHYITSVLRELPITRSYSLQQKFVNQAIKAKMAYERQHPSKQCDCFPPLPQPPVYPAVNTRRKAKPQARKKKTTSRRKSIIKMRNKRNLASDDRPIYAMPIEHLSCSEIKQEPIDHVDTASGLIMEGHHPEIDVEKEPELERDPFEMVPCSDSLELEEGPELERDPFEMVPCSDSLEQTVDSNPHMAGHGTPGNGQMFSSYSQYKHTDKNEQYEPSTTSLKRIRLTKLNPDSSNASSIPSTRNVSRLLTNAPTSPDRPGTSHPTQISRIQQQPNIAVKKIRLRECNQDAPTSSVPSTSRLSELPSYALSYTPEILLPKQITKYYSLQTIPWLPSESQSISSKGLNTLPNNSASISRPHSFYSDNT